MVRDTLFEHKAWYNYSECTEVIFLRAHHLIMVQTELIPHCLHKVFERPYLGYPKLSTGVIFCS